jgi:hypothetical protein
MQVSAGKDEGITGSDLHVHSLIREANGTTPELLISIAEDGGVGNPVTSELWFISVEGKTL